MAVPVNLRSEADPAGGNRFAGVNLAAPIGLHDPEVRIKNIRSQMTRKREERAIDMVGAIAPVLSSVAGQRARVDGRIDRQLRRPGQQCAGLCRRHLHRRREDLAAVRHWPAARGGDDGRADLPRRLLHDHHALRPRLRSPTPTCGPAACWPGSTRCSPSAATVEPRRRRSRSTPRNPPQSHPTEVRRNDFGQRSAQSTDHAAARFGRRDRGQPAWARDRRLLRSRRHPRRRVHRRGHDPGSAAAAPDVRRRVHRHGAGRSQPSARPFRVRGPHRQGRPHAARQLARRHRRTGRAAVRAEDRRSHLSRDARARPRPHGPRPHRGAQLVGADGAG